MGRGRAKAKQTKVARELKYNSGGTDLERLRAELVGAPTRPPAPSTAVDEPDDDLEDLIAKYNADEDDDVEDDEGQPR